MLADSSHLAFSGIQARMPDDEESQAHASENYCLARHQSLETSAESTVAIGLGV